MTGSDKELLQTIRDGDVPRPPLMLWNPWQKWRTTLGGRPTSSADGGTTGNPMENALWKSVMLDLYGPDWTVQVVSLDVTEDGPLEAPIESAATEPASEPSLVPAAAAGEPATEVTAEGRFGTLRRTQEKSLGSGIDIAVSPGSGRASPASWTNRSPGTPNRLRDKVFKSYEPSSEPLEKYTDRVRRQASVLSSVGAGLEPGNLG